MMLLKLYDSQYDDILFVNYEWRPGADNDEEVEWWQ